MSTIEITHTSSELQQVHQTTESHGSWEVVGQPDQEVVSYGSPTDAAVGGRLAVREHAEALRILRDS